jgi:hypothetical protein
LVVGVVDEASGIDEYFSSSSLKKLQVDTVEGLCDKAFREAVLEQAVFTGDGPFFLGGRVMKLLDDSFTEVDVSCSAFRQRYLVS